MPEKEKKYFKSKYSDKFIESVNSMKNDPQLFLKTKDRKKNESKKKINIYFKKK